LGRGGGQGGDTTPSIGMAGDGTAGLAQFGIDFSVVGECRVGRRCSLLVSGIGAWGGFPWAMQESASIGCVVFCREMATGSGAGGGARIGTYCGVCLPSCSGHSVGCCVVSAQRKRGCTVGAGDGTLTSGGGGSVCRRVKSCWFTSAKSRRTRRSRWVEVMAASVFVNVSSSSSSSTMGDLLSAECARA